MNETLTSVELSPLDRAIQCFGTQDAFAAVLGLKSPSITGWKNREQVPAERCIQIEEVTNGQVSRYELRPDVFGLPPKQEAA